MARGHTRTRSAVQGISVRSVDDEPRLVRLADYFSGNPNGSLKEVYKAGDRIRLFDNGEYAYARLKDVKERTAIATPEGSSKPVRLVLEKDLQGRVVGMKESGAKGRRVN